ncbi:type VI secretion system transmembrane protein TssO [Mucilaginibacter sp. L196]|uniref:type VI secretion system transmembrane protein TssO n=1 Tax=Mucilaginibacter sp. L196 TaxID=1641870 RepID=UPI00131EAE2B|nr:type VI secretion system transmembrane protein TssO [Mucilaginibacter sp. L196]
MIKFSLKEKREKFLFFLGMFLITSAILCTAIFYNYGDEVTVSKTEFSRKVNEEEEFETLVAEALPTADTTYAKIEKFNPNVEALFLENDIKGSIGAIKSYYYRRPYDSRYQSFLYASKLYENLFYDKRELAGNGNDIARMTKLLDECKLSTRQLQQSLGVNH